MAGPGAAAAALLPAVLLAVLAPWAGRGGAAAPTAPNGTLGAELERRWESLVVRSLARLPVAAQPKEAAVQSGAGDYLLGIKRLRRLYCNVGIGFHLQVLPDGRIGGVHADTSDSEWGAPARRVGAPGTAAPSDPHAEAPAGTCRRPWEPGRTPVPVPPAGTEASAAPESGGDCLCAPGRTGPASPPSEAPALGAEFQRLRPRGPRSASGSARLGDPGGHPAPAARDWARPPRGRVGRPASAHPRTPGSGAPLHPPPPPETGSRWPAARGGSGTAGAGQGPLPGSDPRPAPRPAGALAGGAGRGEHLRRGQPVLRGHEQQGQAVRLGEYREGQQSTRQRGRIRSLPGRPVYAWSPDRGTGGSQDWHLPPKHKYSAAVRVTQAVQTRGRDPRQEQ